MSDPTLPTRNPGAADDASDSVPRSELSLGPGTEFDGLVLLHGPTRIDGRIRGEIRSQDRIWLGADARVEGRICAEEVVVEGEVAGNLQARQRITLAPTAHVRGTLASPRLRIEEGSQLEGCCEMGGTPAPGSDPKGTDSTSSSP